MSRFVFLLSVILTTRRKYQTQPDAEANHHTDSNFAEKSPKRLALPNKRDKQRKYIHENNEAQLW
jgi:hypothetical protein